MSQAEIFGPTALKLKEQILKSATSWNNGALRSQVFRTKCGRINTAFNVEARVERVKRDKNKNDHYHGQRIYLEALKYGVESFLLLLYARAPRQLREMRVKTEDITKVFTDKCIVNASRRRFDQNLHYLNLLSMLEKGKGNTPVKGHVHRTANTLSSTNCGSSIDSSTIKIKEEEVDATISILKDNSNNTLPQPHADYTHVIIERDNVEIFKNLYKLQSNIFHELQLPRTITFSLAEWPNLAQEHRLNDVQKQTYKEQNLLRSQHQLDDSAMNWLTENLPRNLVWQNDPPNQLLNAYIGSVLFGAEGINYQWTLQLTPIQAGQIKDSETYIIAMVESTRSFYKLSEEQRKFIASIWGIVHTQWCIAILLLVSYPFFKHLINYEELKMLVQHTIELLKVEEQRRSTFKTEDEWQGWSTIIFADIQTLEYVAQMSGIKLGNGELDF